MIRQAALAGLLALAWPASSASAAEGALAPAVDQAEPIRFRAERMLARQDGRIELDGNVRVWQRDTTLEAAHMEVFYAPDERTVQRIVATGGVVVTEPGRRATAREGVFDIPRNRIVLTGRPVMRDGDNELTGSRMTIWRDDGRVEVEHARARLHPDRLPAELSGGARP